MNNGKKTLGLSSIYSIGPVQRGGPQSSRSPHLPSTHSTAVSLSKPLVRMRRTGQLGEPKFYSERCELPICKRETGPDKYCRQRSCAIINQRENSFFDDNHQRVCGLMKNLFRLLGKSYSFFLITPENGR